MKKKFYQQSFIMTSSYLLKGSNFLKVDELSAGSCLNLKSFSFVKRS